MAVPYWQLISARMLTPRTKIALISILALAVVAVTITIIFCVLPHEESVGNDLMDSLNKSVNPCTDFYRYACGQWARHHPPRRGSLLWSNVAITTMDMVPKLRRILNRTNSETDHEAIRKARKIYTVCMDKDRIENAGTGPLESFINDNGGWPLMMKRGEWNSKNLTWQQIYAKLMKTMFIEGLFTLEISPDFKNSSTPRLLIAQPDLLLEREELVSGRIALTTAYTLFKVKLTDVLRRSSNASSEDVDSVALENLNNFERELAEISKEMSHVDDMIPFYNLMTVHDFQNFYDSSNMRSSTAQIDWLEIIRDTFATLTPEIKVDESEQLMVIDKTYFTKLAALLNKTSHETIVNYMMWREIADLSLYTNYELRELIFEFDDERVGANSILPRSLECLVESQMKPVVAYAFVKEYSSAELKEKTSELVENIQEAMKQYIRNSTWLDDETIILANEKISAMAKSIHKPVDYTDAKLDHYYAEFTPTNSYFENELRRRSFMTKNNLRMLRAPMDRNKWYTEPDSVNAFYNPLFNSMIIPAGILQRPFIDFNRPRVIDYGMLGTIIGHEISHALDSNGRRYDKNGNAVTWWPQATIAKYEEQEQCFIDQYNNFTIYDDGRKVIPVNGTFTLSENLADTTGLQVTWEAYKIYRDQRRSNGSKIPGYEEFNDDQIFFLAFANLRCTHESNQFLKDYSPKDNHSPAKVRVNGALSNVDAFAEAFNCPENAPMNPSKKCNIWK